MKAICRLRSLLDIIKFEANHFARALHDLGLIRGSHMSITEREFRDAPVVQQTRELLTEAAEKLLVELRSLGTNAEVSAERLIRQLKERPEFPNDDLIHHCEDIESRLVDDLSKRYVFSLDAREAEDYAEGGFGPAVTQHFHSLAYDIDEGFKCLALSRSTAAAFHFARCLEGGLRAVARCMKVPDPVKGADRNWSKILGDIEAAITARWPTSASRFTADAQFLEWAHATFKVVKSPYRDSTMHLQEKFTLEEARLLMELVKGILQKLSSRMDESGVLRP